MFLRAATIHTGSRSRYAGCGPVEDITPLSGTNLILMDILEPNYTFGTEPLLKKVLKFLYLNPFYLALLRPLKQGRPTFSAILHPFHNGQSGKPLPDFDPTSFVR